MTCNRIANGLAEGRRHDPGRDVLIEREDGAGTLSNGECRSLDDRWQLACEPGSIQRQLAL